MEKRKAHYDLKQVRDLIRSGHWVVTLTAQRNAWECFQLDVEGIKEELLKLEKKAFFKSMTTTHDHTLWQDVYKPMVKQMRAYIKVQITPASTAVVIQFKRR